MTLNVPLSVRLGDTHITRDVAAVRFRKEAVGGVRNITLRLARTLDRVDQITAYTRVYLYDARSGATLAEGRLSDLGRSAGTDGQQWDLVAFGPAQHASDKTVPLIYVDQRQDIFTRGPSSNRNATTDPSGGLDGDTPALEVRADEGKAVTAGAWRGDLTSRALVETGQSVARVRFTTDAGLINADYHQILLLDGASVLDVTATTTATVREAVITTDFANGLQEVTFRANRQTTSTTGVETHWFQFYNLRIRTVLKTAAGTDITAAASYTTNTVLASEVVADLLGRILDQYDGAGASITTTSYTIDQLAYPDGATPAQILDDLMALEPAYRWYAGASNAAGKYAFTWAAWPTSVRYETTLDDGGSFPVSSQELYNEVTVRWKNPNGIVRTTLRTLASAILTAAGVTRRAFIDAGDEVGSLATATKLGDNFLLEHNVPNNAGNLTVSRPIRDLTTGAMVEPFEIESGELIRVRGVESYPDALNASSNDGMTVFRIWSMEYDSDSNSATLELDTYSRTTANALARLTTRRNRKR